METVKRLEPGAALPVPHMGWSRLTRDHDDPLLEGVADGAYANLALPGALRAARLGGRDAAFATELTYGAIRLRGRYDPIIAVAAARGLDAIDPAVLDELLPDRWLQTHPTHRWQINDLRQKERQRSQQLRRKKRRR